MTRLGLDLRLVYIKHVTQYSPGGASAKAFWKTWDLNLKGHSGWGRQTGNEGAHVRSKEETPLTGVERGG